MFNFKKSIICLLAVALICSVCSVAVFAEEEIAEIEGETDAELVENNELLGTAVAPDGMMVTTAAPDDSVSNNADLLTVMSDGEDALDIATNDGEDALDIAINEGKDTGDGALEEVDEEETADVAEPVKKGMPVSAIVLLAIIGAAIVIFAILWIAKPTFRERVKKFFREYRSELKKVVWSPKADVIKNTKIVVIAIVIVAVVVGLIDFGLGKLVDLVGHIGG